MTMRAYFFVRNMSILHADAGHIGWGYEVGDGIFTCGATENTAGDALIWPPNNAGAWIGNFPSELAMLSHMSQVHEFNAPPFQYYKYLDLETVGVPANPGAALEQAQANLTRGYSVSASIPGAPMGNCLDHATDVVNKYGLPWQELGGLPSWGMPWKQTHPEPLDWFQNWNASASVYLPPHAAATGA